MLIRGDFVHTPNLGVLEILEDHLIARSLTSVQLLESRVKSVLEIPKGTILLPTFCDLHLHAPQYLYQGTGLDLPLMQWLDAYALKSEARLDGAPLLARKVYTRLAADLKEYGTGTVLLFGTIKEETNIILAECMQAAGIRGFIGKLSMDIDIRPPESRAVTYVEPSAASSLDAARSFVERCRALVDHLPPPERMVEPVLTPRFVPTCTNDLLKGLGDYAVEQNLKIQSHMAEAKDQVEWVRAERNMEDIDVFDKNNLLTSRTVQAHCTFVTAPDFERLFHRGTAVAHCPLSNAYFSAKPFPLREALDHRVKVGLGTDIAGGYSLDIMASMRQAVVVSRMREGEAAAVALSNDGAPANEQKPSLSIDWKESLFLATRGGSVALGLEGMFKVGAPFDAQEIQLYDLGTGSGFGSLNYFDLEIAHDGPLPLTHEMIEKWWCVGDTRNRKRMWIQGRQV